MSILIDEYKLTATDPVLARAAVDYGRQIYYRSGWNQADEDYLVRLLSREHETMEEAEKTATEFKDFLWARFSSSMTAIRVTYAIYAGVGRSKETNENWI